MLETVLPAFGFIDDSLEVKTFGNGLINSTWKVLIRDKAYILQKINDQVFSRPEDIAYNINAIANFLEAKQSAYSLVVPVTTPDGRQLVFIESIGYFRAFPFVEGSHAKDVVETKNQAFQAASQFAKFTAKLAAFDVSNLKITIPSFHDLSLRYQQFTAAMETGNAERIRNSSALIEKIKEYADVEAEYRQLIADENVKLRVTHHDAKISNVLFDDNDKGLCVIDLDTVMPGYFFSDIGDMMRTYLCPVSEEEGDFSKIEIRDEFYKAIVDGYYSEMKEELSEKEKKCFFYAGKFIIYMQALRFLTDYLNNDIYYGAKYVEHNKVRAGNQLTLLQKLIEKENELGSYMPG